MKFLSSPRFCLLLAFAILPLAVTNESLWLDEGDTAMYALEPTLHSWCDRLLHDGQADCQMPLSMFCAWAAGKIFGTGEWQLRAINVFWGALALVAMHRVGRRLQLPWLPLLLAIQPFFWFYLNEARPFALELGCGAWLLAALVDFNHSRARGSGWAWQLSLGGFFLYCSTLLAPLPVATVVLVAGFIAWRQGWRPQREAVLILLGGLAACLPVAAYYVSTLLRGTMSGQVWHVDLKFIAYVFYEFTGMGGIGLGGEEIRSLARSPNLVSELISHLPQLALPLLLGLLLVMVLCLGLRRRNAKPENRLTLLGIVSVLAVTSGVFIVVSLALQKAFWARHYSPVFPFYVALLGFAFAGIGSSPRRWLRLLPLTICALLLCSALNFRFAPSLRKEDYRSTAGFVRPLLVQGKSVWWLASGYPANYYGMDAAYFNPEPGKVFVAFRSREDVRTLPLPDVVVVNKPDLHDPSGAVQKIISKNQYAMAARYQGFVIWTNAAPGKR